MGMAYPTLRSLREYFVKYHFWYSSIMFRNKDIPQLEVIQKIWLDYCPAFYVIAYSSIQASHLTCHSACNAVHYQANLLCPDMARGYPPHCSLFSVQVATCVPPCCPCNAVWALPGSCVVSLYLQCLMLSVIYNRVVIMSVRMWVLKWVVGFVYNRPVFFWALNFSWVWFLAQGGFELIFGRMLARLHSDFLPVDYSLE